MDSCNSESLQSSSCGGGGGGGDEDYETSNYFTSSGDASLTNLANFQPPTSSHHHYPPPPTPYSSSLFESLPSYLDAFNPAWSNPLRPSPATPDPNRSDTTPITATKSGQASFLSNTSTTQSSSPVQASRGAPRTSKKRSRASRRAPTTVLTTDPANFRAMVQEFTGIPTPAFMSPSPFSRPPAPLDLLHAMPPYLLRPFTQTLGGISSTCNSSMAIRANNANTSSSNSPDQLNIARRRQQQQQSSILDMQKNPMITFQSLLQSSLTNKYSSSTLQGSSMISSSPVAPNYGHPRAMPSQIAPSDPTVLAGGSFGPEGGGDPMQFRRMADDYRKLNSSGLATMDQFNSKKENENNVPASRDEGAMDSWIFSSD